MLIEGWARVLLLVAIWLVLCILLALGMARWMLQQRRLDQAQQQAVDQAVMDLLEGRSNSHPKDRSTSGKSQD